MAHMPAEQLLNKLKGSLNAWFDAAAPVALRTAPGHIDVLGGLAVEAGGTVAQMTVPRRAVVAVQLKGEPVLLIHRDAIHATEPVVLATFHLDTFFCAGRLLPPRELLLTIPPADRWAAPIVAAWYVLAQSGRLSAAKSPVPDAASTAPRGIAVAFISQLPPGAGLGSTTALIAAVIQAMCDAANGFIQADELALYGGRAEYLLPDGFGHVVDAMTALHTLDAPGPHVLRLSAQPHSLAGQIRLPADLRIMALDTAIRSSARAQRLQNLRIAGAMGLRIVETIYKDLGQRHTPLRGYLANISPSLYRQYFRAIVPRRMRGADFIRSFGALPERAGTIEPDRIYRVRTTVDHLISENEHAENFLQAIEELIEHQQGIGPRLSPLQRERTLRRAGRLMLASQHSYRLRLEQSCPEADWLVDTLMQDGPEHGVYGARISGWGGGGTVVALLKRGSAVDDILLRLLEPYRQRTGHALGLLEAGTTGSAGMLV